MRATGLLILTFLCGVAAAPDPLQGERWRHRLFLVFAPGESDVSLAAQRQALAAAGAGLRERDVRVLEVVGDSAPTGMTAAALRRQFSVGRGFEVVLVGKDGGEKFREVRPVPAARLFAVIDAMPMRQDEIRRQAP